MRMTQILIAMVLLCSCASNLSKYETQLASRSDENASSLHELAYRTTDINDSERVSIANPLPIYDAGSGKGYILPLAVPEGANSLYFRSILSTAFSKTSHVAYPTFFFLNHGFQTIEEVKPDVRAVYAGNLDSHYFEGQLPLPQSTSFIAAFFDPNDFGKQLRFNVSQTIAAMGGGIMLISDKDVDHGVPVGPGGPFRFEFREELSSAPNE